MCDHAPLDHPRRVQAVTVPSVLVPVSVSVDYPDPLLVVYSAVPPVSAKAGQSRHTSTERTKTRFPARSMKASVKWDDKKNSTDR